MSNLEILLAIMLAVTLLQLMIAERKHKAGTLTPQDFNAFGAAFFLIVVTAGVWKLFELWR